MLFLVDSYVTEQDHNGNPRKLIRVACVRHDEMTNILWLDASYKGIPKTPKQLSEQYDFFVHDDDVVNHVQNYELKPETWNSLSVNCDNYDFDTVES
jgi:hypothetical protein